jgi:transposase-like protein
MLEDDKNLSFKSIFIGERNNVKCPKCEKEMTLEDNDTSSGRDMRTYRCDHCQGSHIVEYGVALRKVQSGARKSEPDR